LESIFNKAHIDFQEPNQALGQWAWYFGYMGSQAHKPNKKHCLKKLKELKKKNNNALVN
jgi:hypothetical protein